MGERSVWPVFVVVFFLALALGALDTNAGPNARAVGSLDFVASGTGNQVDDKAVTGTVSGRGTDIVVEMFAAPLAVPVIGGEILFSINPAIIRVKRGSLMVPRGMFALGTSDTSASIGGFPPGTQLANGYYGTVTFTTQTDVTGIEFNIGVKRFIVVDGTATQTDTLRNIQPITINGQTSFIEAIPGDINRDGNVNFADFIIFTTNFGRQGPVPSDPIRTVTRTLTVRDTIYQIRTVRDTIKVTDPIKRDTLRVTLFDSEGERTPEKSSWAEVVRVVEKSTYLLGYTARGNYQIKFVGTGFCIGPWFIATNAHVADALWQGVNRVRTVQNLDGYAVAIKANTIF